MGSRAALDQSLFRLVQGGEIQRLGARPVPFSRMNERPNIPLGPHLDEIAEALGRQTGIRGVPSGAVAANRLGLSTQVPAIPVYLSDGRTRQVRISTMAFQIRHAAPKELPAGSRTIAMVFQALRHLGQANVDDPVVGQP